MGDTIATLGIKVTSTGVKETSENLDKVSKSSEKAQKAIDKLLESYKQQEIRAKGGKAGLAEYKLSLLGATEAEKKFAAETIKATQAIQNNAKTLDQSIKALLSLAQAGSAIFIFQKVGGALKSFFNDVLEVTKSTQSMQIALNAATGSANLGKEAFSFLRIESERLGLVLNDQVKGFSRIAAAAKGTALEGQGIKDVYSSISEASTVLQLSTDDTMGVLKALTDIISKGTVQAEELRGQLGDRLPGAFQIAADAMEMTTEELNKQLKAGKVLSEDFLPKFAKKIKEQFAGSVEEASKSIQANLNRTENAWEQLKRTMYSAFNEDLNKLIIDTTKYIKNLTDRLGDPDVQKDIKDITDALRLMADVGIDIGNLAIYLSKVLKPLKELNDAVADGLNPWKAYTFFLKKIVKDDSDLLKEENKNTKDFLKDMSSQWSEWEKETNDIIKRRESKKPKGIERDEKEVKRLLESLQEENDQLTLSTDALIRKKAALAGATKEEIELLSALTSKNEAIKQGTKASKEAEAQENKRVKFIEDYISKLEQEADTYKKGKEYTADYILSLKDATEAQKQRAKVAGAFIDEAKRLDAAEKKNKKNLEDYAALMKKVMPEFERDELSRQQALELTATIFKDKLTPAMMGTAAALHLFDEQSEAIKNINEYFDTKEIDDFTKKTDELKDKLKFEGTSFGNEIADGINNAILSMNDFNDQLDKNKILQKDIEKFQKEIDKTSDPKLKAQKQKALDEVVLTGIESQLDAYRQLFGTTSQLFKENSKERKALHNLEMAFAMAEIAMNLQKTISAAYTAIMIQGTGDPYSAFGRIAAMTALAGGIVAAAGGSLSGGGSGSAPTAVSGASQSTALGSTEQSQSITNAFSFLEDIESGQYNELKDISSSMKDLNKNITGLVTSIVRTGGVSDFAGVAGTQKTGASFLQSAGLAIGTMGLSLLTPAFDLINKKAKENEAVTQALTAIAPLTLGSSLVLSSMISNVSGALFGGSKKTSILASGLQITPGTIESGQYSTQAYADIKVKKEGGLFGSDKTYFKTLTDEVDQSVQDMVSLVFKNMGETMVDIAKGFGTENLEEVFNYVFDIGKIDLKGLDTEGINKALQEAFSTASDKAATDLFGELIGRYQKIGEGILETAVRLVGEKAVIMDVLELTNQGFEGSDIPAKALEVTQALIDMSGGLDNLTDAAATYYDKFFSDAEKQTRLQGQLTESFSSLNLELPKTREGYRAIIEGLDLTTEAGQKTYVSLLGLSEGADKYYTSLENGNKVLAENQKNILSINSGLEKSIAQMDMTPFEKSLDDVNTSTANTIKTLKDYGATEDQLANARLYGQKQIDFLTKAEEKRIEDLEKANKRLYDNKMVELLEAEGKSTEALILKRQLELEGMDESLVPMQKRIYELQDEKKALELSQKANKEFTDSLMASIKAQEDAIKAQADLVNNQSYDLYLELLKEEGKISSAQNLERKSKLNELNHAGLEDTQKEIWALQDKRKQQEMMVTILELEGKTNASLYLSRQLELQTMEDSLKPLQLRIWQLQDEKTRQEEIIKTTDYLNSVSAKTIEILVLEGKTVEATALSRQIELTKMEEGLKPLQLRIWALEDAKKADEESVKAIEERIHKENSKNNMLVTLLELEGNASEALKIKRMLEINALDESLKPMQERIWALQDQAIEEQKIKTIADKRNELNIRQLRAMGKEEQALAFERTLELNAIDETLRAKQVNIWLLEDEKEAQEKANVILKEKSDLELEILRLTLSETEYLAISRQKELESIDGSNVALKERIFQLTDEQAAIEKAKELSLKKQSLEIESLKITGNETEALRLQRSLELLEIDDSLKSLQERNWALQDEKDALEKANQIAKDLADKEIELAEKKSDLLIKLMVAEGKTAEATAAQRLIEINALDDSLKPIQEKIWLLEDEKTAQEEATAALEKANEERKTLLEKQLSDSEDMLKKSIDKQISFYQTLVDEANKKLEDARSLLDRSFVAEQETITKKHESLIAGLTERLNEAQTAASDLENVFNSLSDARKSMEGASGGITYKAVQKQLVDALTMARIGNVSGAKELVPNLGILTSQGAENYGSQAEYKRDFFRTYNSLSELEKLTGTQLTDQQQIVKSLETQIEQANINNQATLEALQAQYDAVLGVDKSIISFQEAITQYQKAQYEADGANALLKSQTEILNNQLNALIGIDTGILSVEAAINNLIAAQAALSSISQSSIPAFASGGIHYGGLRIVGESGPELEYTPPANITSNNDLKTIMSNEEIVAELKAMRTEMARANFEIVKNTADSSKTLKKFDYDGMPETRTA